MRGGLHIFLGILATALICGCAVENPTYRDILDGEVQTSSDSGATSPGPDSGVPAPASDRGPAPLCIPGTFLGCAGPVKLKRCDETGFASEIESCPKGCNLKSQRCNDCNINNKPRCVGDSQVSCNARGLVVKVACPFGCQAGACKSCNMKTYYADVDGDGYGDSKSPQQACAQPEDFVLNKLDCHDGSTYANPKQMGYFSKPIPGSNDFDYNCDKTQERQRLAITLGDCTFNKGACAGSGWMLIVPKCGGGGFYLNCVAPAGSTTCAPILGMATQACR